MNEYYILPFLTNEENLRKSNVKTKENNKLKHDVPRKYYQDPIYRNQSLQINIVIM